MMSEHGGAGPFTLSFVIQAFYARLLPQPLLRRMGREPANGWLVLSAKFTCGI
jgi:hypothetical protein